MLPGDRITLFSGQTVEILNADAEGRRYRFVDPVYGELRCQWGETLYVNDAPMQYSGFDNYGKLTMQEK